MAYLNLSSLEEAQIRRLGGAARFGRAREWCLVLVTTLALALGWKSRAWWGRWPWARHVPTSLAGGKVFPRINSHPFGYALSPFSVDLASTGRVQIAALGSSDTSWRPLPRAQPTLFHLN